MIWIGLVCAFVAGFIVGRIRKSSGVIFFIDNSSYMELYEPVERIKQRKTAQIKISAKNSESI